LATPAGLVRSNIQSVPTCVGNGALLHGCGVACAVNKMLLLAFVQDRPSQECCLILLDCRTPIGTFWIRHMWWPSASAQARSEFDTCDGHPPVHSESCDWYSSCRLQVVRLSWSPLLRQLCGSSHQRRKHDGISKISRQADYVPKNTWTPSWFASNAIEIRGRSCFSRLLVDNGWWCQYWQLQNHALSTNGYRHENLIQTKVPTSYGVFRAGDAPHDLEKSQ